MKKNLSACIKEIFKVDSYKKVLIQEVMGDYWINVDGGMVTVDDVCKHVGLEVDGNSSRVKQLEGDLSVARKQLEVILNKFTG